MRQRRGEETHTPKIGSQPPGVAAVNTCRLLMFVSVPADTVPERVNLAREHPAATVSMNRPQYTSCPSQINWTAYNKPQGTASVGHGERALTWW